MTEVQKTGSDHRWPFMRKTGSGGTLDTGQGVQTMSRRIRGVHSHPKVLSASTPPGGGGDGRAQNILFGNILYIKAHQLELGIPFLSILAVRQNISYGVSEGLGGGDTVIRNPIQFRDLGSWSPAKSSQKMKLGGTACRL